jgi:flagellar FliJ protein
MTRSDKLKPAARVAESRERTAARALGASQQRLAESEAKLEELYRYRDEYARRLASASGGLDAGQLADFRAFLTRLNEAITYQEARVHEAQAQREQSRGTWVHTRRKADAIGKVMTRCIDQERREEDRREQKDTDERSQRRKTPLEEGDDQI